MDHAYESERLGDRANMPMNQKDWIQIALMF